MKTLTTTHKDNLLEIKGLSVFVFSKNRSRILVKDLNLPIERGSFTALVGKSGLGKSITIKSVLGFLDSASWKLEGSIDYISKSEGEENEQGEKTIISRQIPILESGIYNREHVKDLVGRQIVSIFQGPDTHLNPSLSTGWQIGEMLDPKKPLLETGKIEKRLTDVELPAEAKDKYPFQLSQGQKQRVLISLALGGAELVIADEPTSSLDIRTKSRIIKLLKDLREQSLIKTLLLITHDLDTLSQLLRASDPVYVLDYNAEGNATIVQHCSMSDVIGAKKSIHPILRPLVIPQSKPSESGDKHAPLLKIRELRQNYTQGLFKKDLEVLKGIDLEIRRGEILGIVGESACGKTTLVKSVLRLCNRTEGKILFKKTDSDGYSDLIKIQPKGLRADNEEMRKLRCRIQVIFQNSASTFNQRMMIHEILSETIKLTGITDEEKIFNIIVERLIRFKLCKNTEDTLQILTKFPFELSGGEKQRLAILRSFLFEPEILFADEPLAEQDVITKSEIIEMFQTVNRKGCTLVIISHDLNLIKGLCNRILHMKEGKLTEFNKTLN